MSIGLGMLHSLFSILIFLQWATFRNNCKSVSVSLMQTLLVPYVYEPTLNSLDKFCWEFQYIMLLHFFLTLRNETWGQLNGRTRDFQNLHVSPLKIKDSCLWRVAKVSFVKYRIGTVRHFAFPHLWAFWRFDSGVAEACRSPGILHCVAAWSVHDVSKQRGVHIFKCVKAWEKRHFDPWRQILYIASKDRDPITHWRSVISQANWILFQSVTF
jgi:hypothetical protein